jgi:serine/threonine-protein phosphatase 4 regulatory subunit 1
LKPVYSALAKDLQWKVRRTLSHSLHEVAKILGPELTEENLLPTFELFLNDLDQVKVGVIRNISSFLAILSPESRDTYVSTLIEIQKESVNWRFRQLLALFVFKLF